MYQTCRNTQSITVGAKALYNLSKTSGDITILYHYAIAYFNKNLLEISFSINIMFNNLFMKKDDIMFIPQMFALKLFINSKALDSMGMIQLSRKYTCVFSLQSQKNF